MTAERDPWKMLREVQLWIASYGSCCVGADEMCDRIADCLQSRPKSGEELAAKHGFKPHDPKGKS